MGSEYTKKIVFGAYYQGANKEVAPLEWIVLGVRMNKALLISKYALEASAYCDSEQAKQNPRMIEWEHSIAREWCNQTFYQEAFSNQEKEILCRKGIDGAGFGYGYVCRDFVFLLTEKGVRKYLQDTEDRLAMPTDYAKAQGVFIRQIDDSGYCGWWIQPECVKGEIATYPSGEQYRGSIWPKAVNPVGEIKYGSVHIDLEGIAIRPCILVDLEKAKLLEFTDFAQIKEQEYEYYKLGFGAIIRVNREKEQLDRLDARHNVWIEDPGLFQEFMFGNYAAKRIGFDDIFSTDK